MTMRKLLTTGAVTALVGLGAVAATTTTASAYTVCNRYGDCWHESSRYHYPPALGVRFYGDDWRHRHRWDHDRGDRYRWREHHEGRGYWRNGLWITF